MSSANKENLLLLFDRPTEPVFMEKGKTSTVFDVPDKFLTDRYRPIGNEVQSRYGDSADIKVPVRDIRVPDLRIPMSLGRDEQFSLFIPKHRTIAGRLIDIFMGMRTIDDLLSMAAYARDRVNPYMFNYALSVTLLHRTDTKDLDLPSYAQNFPDKFVDSQVFRQVREEVTVVPEGSRMPIVVPRDYTASDLDPEHRLWYFREDIGINLHHWHWHLVYPFEASDRSIVAKDRRGELFYYMHQQIIARYNMERFSNNLARVTRLNNFREPIQEGYFPKMDSLVASRAWPPRFQNTQIKDLKRQADQITLDVGDLERWRDRILEAIHMGYAVDEQNQRRPLDETTGIDTLGNMMESSIISPNRALYGDFHNQGHVFIAYSHDPDHRYLESFGVMGDSTTAMRDPVFYRWHAYIDDIFQEHKRRLPPYSQAQLQYDGVSITGVQVASEGGQPNILSTFWQQSDLDLSRGMDFVPRGNVFARFTHLQHTPFTYTINVNNAGGAMRFGMVRIFIAPKHDERGQPMLFNEQRLLMVELDKFVASLNPGKNTIKRRSTESSVTIPFERTFRNLDTNRPAANSAGELEFNFCGCGWPQHMLIPKGRPEGLPCELFVMVSNYEDDRIDQQLVGSCSDAASYCGVRDRLYPDRRPMGFPFDRLPRQGADRLINFLTPNMSMVDVSIRHDPNRVVQRQN
ncbi:phenoloxidase 2-like [Lucilia cuprina]|uniref:phenoloxidase 2-like n=1 Tax=Lucilia cuprina TaxID=7375 RepID=UPI001F062CCA|nr:phenoloxidase 2-like [Lucilia cuprina]